MVELRLKPGLLTPRLRRLNLKNEKSLEWFPTSFPPLKDLHSCLSWHGGGDIWEAEAHPLIQCRSRDLSIHMASAVCVYSDFSKCTARISRQLSQSNFKSSSSILCLDQRSVDLDQGLRIPQGSSGASRGLWTYCDHVSFCGCEKIWIFLRRGFIFFIKFSKSSPMQTRLKIINIGFVSKECVLNFLPLDQGENQIQGRNAAVHIRK